MNQMNKKWTKRRWKGFTDKNNDKLYAPKQLLSQNNYNVLDKEIFEKHVSKI